MAAASVPTDNLQSIETVTLSHYSSNAADFWHGTKDHDVSQNYAAFLTACLQEKSENTSLDILDFGCGPGRDLHYFHALGHRPVGLDGCERFCQMAQEYSGCSVLHQQFLSLDLPTETFDGVFANASLFHVPASQLPRVLRELHATLRTGGILFSSNPRGNAEGWSGSRFGHWMELEASQRYLQQAGFTLLHHYYRPAGKPQAEQPWLAIISQKN
jgi:SAM-dependent methyltransferase